MGHCQVKKTARLYRKIAYYHICLIYGELIIGPWQAGMSAPYRRYHHPAASCRSRSYEYEVMALAENQDYKSLGYTHGPNLPDSATVLSCQANHSGSHGQEMDIPEPARP